jgi:uncharacterized membrane protein
MRRPRRVLIAAAPGLILIPLVLPVPFPYKLYLEILGMMLFVAVYIVLAVADLRVLKRTRVRQDAEFKDFVRAQTANRP